MASSRIRDNSVLQYFTLPRFKLKHSSLIIDEHTKYFDPDNLTEQDYLNWQKEFDQEIEKKDRLCHETFHKLRCKFIFEFYLEFWDCQYLKNIGYRRTTKKDDWDSIYWSYLQIDRREYPISLEKVLDDAGSLELEDRDYSEPIKPFEIDDYIEDSKNYFFSWLQSRFAFNPNWGRWWKDDREYSELDVENIEFRKFFDRWWHPDLPEEDWIRQETLKILNRLTEEYNTNSLWNENLSCSWNTYRDCFWNFKSKPLISPFKPTSLRLRGYVTNIESKIDFFLYRKLNWEATKDRVNKRALRVIEKRKAKKQLDEEIQDDRRYLAH